MKFNLNLEYDIRQWVVHPKILTCPLINLGRGGEERGEEGGEGRGRRGEEGRGGEERGEERRGEEGMGGDGRGWEGSKTSFAQNRALRF